MKKNRDGPGLRKVDCTPRVLTALARAHWVLRSGRHWPGCGNSTAAPPRIQGFDTMIMPKAPFTPPASYEAALEELDQLVGLIESGQLPLEQLLTGYQRGAELLQFCRQKLQAVENQIKILDEGTLKPWMQE
jgi:exodeoxyribonuclease VII small subunit